MARDPLFGSLFENLVVIRAVEIKAGATVDPDYFRGLSGFAATYPDALEGGSVVYGGDTDQMRSDWPVIP